MTYPEHEKVKDLHGKNEVVGRFIEWLEERDLIVCERTQYEFDNLYVPARQSLEQLIAEHFEIDRAALEAEKRAMLAELRAKP